MVNQYTLAGTAEGNWWTGKLNDELKKAHYAAEFLQPGKHNLFDVLLIYEILMRYLWNVLTLRCLQWITWVQFFL